MLGRAVRPLCPLAAFLLYMARSKPGKGPLFQFENGRPLIRDHFMREVLQQIGMEPKIYAGHSFRIRAATTAVRKGIHTGLTNRNIRSMGKCDIPIIYQNTM